MCVFVCVRERVRECGKRRLVKGGGRERVMIYYLIGIDVVPSINIESERVMIYYLIGIDVVPSLNI